MNQTLWMRAIANTEKQSIIPSLFNFRLRISQIAIYSMLFASAIVQILLLANEMQANVIPSVVILITSVAALIFSYLRPQNSGFLFYALPIYGIVLAKLIDFDLVRLYGEIFIPFYFALILMNYLLCSSRLALSFSIITALAAFSFYDNFNTFWIAYALFIFGEIMMGYFIAKKYETRVQDTEVRENTDDLTSLLNHNGFVREVKKATYTEKHFYAVLIDIDRFEELGDSIGSMKADEILRAVAAELANFPESFAHSRFNTDKFAFLSHARNALILTAQLEKFEKDIKFISDKYSLDNTISFSSGIVLYPEQASEVPQLLSFAEIALEKSKTSKLEERNTFFIREYLDDKKRTYTIQKDLLSACRNGELQVYYQPKVSLVDRVVTGMEALSRWTHPSIGYVSPKEFVEIAEKSGHIITLGEFVMESALYHIRNVHDLGLKDVSISINVSPLQLLQDGFCENVYTQAQNFGVEPSKIYLEITEGTMLKKDASTILKRLKHMGFNLSLDDFGTGYSSLNYLHKYSFDELKIDKSFTDGLMRGRNERRLFKFLILLARELGMKTVTEGVEDDVQIKLLQGLGAEEIQGWYYSKALSSFDCIEYIRNFQFKDSDDDAHQATGSFADVKA